VASFKGGRSRTTIAENNAIGDVVGVLSAIGTDTRDQHAYTFVESEGTDDNNLFTIQGDRLKAARVFDYESQKTRYTVRVRVTDAGNLWVEQRLTIGVTDVDDNAPTITSGTTGTVAENADASTPIYTVALTDDYVRPPRPGERIVFLGDSITFRGDVTGGYVDLVRRTLSHTFPGASMEVINAGVGGNKVTDLQNRLDGDVLAKHPSTVVIYIGINDVWLSEVGRGTPIRDFENGLRDLVARIRAVGSRVILCTPSVIGERPVGGNSLDPMLDEYSGLTRTLASALCTGLIDLRRAFLAHIAAVNTSSEWRGILTNDGVHMNPAGDEFIATTMLEGLGVTPVKPVGGDAIPKYRTASFSIKAGVGDADFVHVDPATGVVTLASSADYETKASYTFTVVATNWTSGIAAEQMVTVTVSDVAEVAAGYGIAGSL